MIRPIPEGYHTVSPIMVFKNVRKAIDFYIKAFGAEQTFLMPGPHDTVVHAELKIGDSPVMMSEENDRFPHKSAETLGESPVSFYLYVNDADQSFRKAVLAGAREVMQMQDALWGDRIGQVRDPFGYLWTFATHKKDVSPEDMQKAAEAMFASSGSFSNGG